MFCDTIWKKACKSLMFYIIKSCMLWSLSLWYNKLNEFIIQIKLQLFVRQVSNIIIKETSWKSVFQKRYAQSCEKLSVKVAKNEIKQIRRLFK